MLKTIDLRGVLRVTDTLWSNSKADLFPFMDFSIVPRPCRDCCMIDRDLAFSSLFLSSMRCILDLPCGGTRQRVSMLTCCSQICRGMTQVPHPDTLANYAAELRDKRTFNPAIFLNSIYASCMRASADSPSSLIQPCLTSLSLDMSRTTLSML